MANIFKMYTKNTQLQQMLVNSPWPQEWSFYICIFLYSWFIWHNYRGLKIAPCYVLLFLFRKANGGYLAHRSLNSWRPHGYLKSWSAHLNLIFTGFDAHNTKLCCCMHVQTLTGRAGISQCFSMESVHRSATSHQTLSKQVKSMHVQNNPTVSYFRVWLLFSATKCFNVMIYIVSTTCTTYSWNVLFKFSATLF